MGIQSAGGYFALNSDGVTPFQHPVELDRNLAEAMFRQSGALRGGDWAIAPTGTNQQISIAAGAGFINGQESAQQGGYFGWSDVSENKTFGAPSGSPRIDTLLLRAYDPQYGTLPSGTCRMQWDIVAGTPGATPVPQPDSAFISTGGQWVPGAWMKWAEVRINPGDTVIPAGQIYLPGSVVSGVGTTWSARYARGASSPILCTNASRPASPKQGDIILEIDTGAQFYYSGSAWVLLSAPIITIERAADLSRVNTTTLATDPILFLSGLPQNATFRVDTFWSYAGSTTGDFKLGWTCDGTGATFDWCIQGIDSSSTNLAGTDYHGINTLAGSDIMAGVGAGQKTFARPGGILKTGTGANITFRPTWSQGTIDAVNGSTVFAATRMMLTRLA
jgi:hypothetical protein